MDIENRLRELTDRVDLLTALVEKQDKSLVILRELIEKLKESMDVDL